MKYSYYYIYNNIVVTKPLLDEKHRIIHLQYLCQIAGGRDGLHLQYVTRFLWELKALSSFYFYNSLVRYIEKLCLVHSYPVSAIVNE